LPLATPQGSKEYNTGRKFALFVVLFEKYRAVLSGVPRNTFCVYPFRLPLTVPQRQAYKVNRFACAKNFLAKIRRA
jgi:hypothetical protein